MSSREVRPPSNPPPHDLTAEEALLGGALLKPTVVLPQADFVRPSDFYKPTHGHIWEAITTMAADGEIPDPVTVAHVLRHVGLLEVCGGPAALLVLQSNTPSTSNARRYATIVHEHARRRDLLALAGDLADIVARAARPADAAKEVLDRVEEIISATNCEIDIVTAAEAIDQVLSLVEDQQEGKATVWPTGWSSIDQVLQGGLRPAELSSIWARTSMGKSVWAANLAVQMAQRGVRVGYVTLEMAARSVMGRMLASAGRFDASRFRDGAWTLAQGEALTRAVTKLHELPLAFLDATGVTPTEVANFARRSFKGGCQVLIVDYYQILSPEARESERQSTLQRMTDQLQVIARKNSVHVHAAAQVGQHVDNRADKRPQLSDCRESGSLGMAADIVMSLFREDYYDRSVSPGVIEVGFLKQRSGESGPIRRMAWRPVYQRIDELEVHRAPLRSVPTNGQ